MKTRTLKELYQILYNHLLTLDEWTISGGLCFVICDLEMKYGLITDDEERKLTKHFKSQKPTSKKHVKFFKHPSFSGKGYWWDYRSESEQRVLFIKYLSEIC